MVFFEGLIATIAIWEENIYSSPFHMGEETMEQNTQPEKVYCIVEAHEVMVLRILLRQAIPMLKRPEDLGKDRRRDLAIMIGLALDGMDTGVETGGNA